MLKIRLRRMGSRHRPFYRVVVGDSRRTPQASALEEIGHYDPRTKPAALDIDVARADHWLSHGAQPSATVERLLEQARTGPGVPVEPAAETNAPAAKAPKAVAKPDAETKAPAEKAPKAVAKPAAEAEAPAEPIAEAAAAETESPAEPAAEAEAPAAAAEAEKQ